MYLYDTIMRLCRQQCLSLNNIEPATQLPPCLCGCQAAAAPVPTSVAAQPGAPYSSDRLPEVGSLVVFANGAVAAKHKARHAWGVMRVTAVKLHGGVSVCGVVDGVELASGIEPSDLAQPGESTGWLGVHFAVAMGCGLGVVGAMLEAHPEVTMAVPSPMCLLAHSP